MRPPNYNPSNWYWYVGGDQTQAYASVSGVFVPAADATFQAFLASGNPPSKIDTAANLGSVIAIAGAPRPIDASVLAGYQNAKVNNLDNAILKVLFNHENRIRTLEGKTAITMQQAINGFTALL